MNKMLIGIGILLAAAPLCGMAAPTFLVEAGRPRAQIVIAEQPARMTRIAASELQTYIEKISGATLHAVYAFLDDLGVRWYMPGELGEVVPARRDIPLPAVNVSVRPDSSCIHRA